MSAKAVCDQGRSRVVAAALWIRKPIFATTFGVIAVSSVFLGGQIYARWHGAEVKTADQARSTTTGDIARLHGAKVLPTQRQLIVEPPSRVAC